MARAAGQPSIAAFAVACCWAWCRDTLTIARLRTRGFLRPVRRVLRDRLAGGLAAHPGEALTSQVIAGPGQCLLVFPDYHDGGAVLQQSPVIAPLRSATQGRAGDMSGVGRGSEGGGWIPAPGVR